MGTVGNNKMAFDDIQQLFATLATHSPSPLRAPATPTSANRSSRFESQDSRTGGGLRGLLADTNVLDDLMNDQERVRYGRLDDLLHEQI